MSTEKSVPVRDFLTALIEVFHLKIPLSLSALILLGNILTLIIQLLSFCQADLHLGETSLKVNFQRYQCISLYGILPAILWISLL